MRSRTKTLKRPLIEVGPRPIGTWDLRSETKFVSEKRQATEATEVQQSKRNLTRTEVKEVPIDSSSPIKPMF